MASITSTDYVGAYLPIYFHHVQVLSTEDDIHGNATYT